MSLHISRQAADLSVADLDRRYAGAPAQDLVSAIIRREFCQSIALVSSFGAGSAVLLHMVAQTRPNTPVIFLDTLKHFGETKRYRNALAIRLGLSDVRSVGPNPSALAAADTDGLLFRRDPDGCCRLRKALPMQSALAGFDAWITGRRRAQSAGRASMPVFESDAAGRIKINPLASWSDEDVADYFVDHELPRHPLEAEGYLSIGCMPCTERVAAGGDARSGRWQGSTKQECGIHTALTRASLGS